MTFYGTYMMMAILLIVVGIIVALGAFVYRDAPKHGMARWPWILIVCFVPNLMGLIVYLIVRSNNKKTKCINCGKEIEGDFTICPYCKHDMSLKCNHCGKKVSSEWTVCPYCTNNLNNKIENN